jgi:hypothetical protein
METDTVGAKIHLIILTGKNFLEKIQKRIDYYRVTDYIFSCEGKKNILFLP